jgi:hypothetical protein
MAAATGGPVLGVHYRAFEKIRSFGLAKLVAPDTTDEAL